MSSHRMPLRVMLLITVHVVSTVALVALVVWTLILEQEANGAIIAASVFWPRKALVSLMISQFYLVVFWICLGNSVWVRRLVLGSLILVGMGATFLGVQSESANRTSELVLLLVQLLVIALALLAIRLTGRHLVTTLPDRKVWTRCDDESVL